MALKDDSFQARFMRESVVQMIEEAKIYGGGKFDRSSQEMEQFIYEQSTTRSEYTDIVASTLRYLKDQRKHAANPPVEIIDETEQNEESEPDSAQVNGEVSDPSEVSTSTDKPT